MKAYKFDENKHFESAINAQVDPLASKKEQKEIYLLPASCTWKEPLPEKEGYFNLWNGENWEYEKIPEDPKPTEEELKEQVRGLRNIYLSYWDFSQLIDAPFDETKKERLRQYRQYLRDYTEKDNWWLENPLNFEEWDKINETLANNNNSGS